MGTERKDWGDGSESLTYIWEVDPKTPTASKKRRKQAMDGLMGRMLEVSSPAATVESKVKPPKPPKMWKRSVTALALKTARDYDAGRIKAKSRNAAFVQASRQWARPDGKPFDPRSLASAEYYDREYRKKGHLPGTQNP